MALSYEPRQLIGYVRSWLVEEDTELFRVTVTRDAATGLTVATKVNLDDRVPQGVRDVPPGINTSNQRA